MESSKEGFGRKNSVIEIRDCFCAFIQFLWPVMFEVQKVHVLLEAQQSLLTFELRSPFQTTLSPRTKILGNQKKNSAPRELFVLGS